MKVWTLFAAGLGAAACATTQTAEPQTAPSATAPALPVASHGATETLLHVGDPAPAFFLPILNAAAAGAKVFDLRQYVGESPDFPTKAVLVSFFATWCAPCKKELPFLVNLAETYKKGGLQVVSIAIDKEDGALSQVKQLIETNHVVHPVVADQTNLVARRFFGTATKLPAVFLVRRDGTIAMMKQGYDGDVSALVTEAVRTVLSE
jgi:thiol-disulfide isomerase/thioredoxin